MMTLKHSFKQEPLCCKLSDVDPEWFFSELPDEIEKAQSICTFCPVKGECLEWAILVEQGQRYIWGIYGGLTTGERKMLA